jgi:hypothetical protein
VEIYVVLDLRKARSGDKYKLGWAGLLFWWRAPLPNSHVADGHVPGTRLVTKYHSGKTCMGRYENWLGWNLANVVPTPRRQHRRNRRQGALRRCLDASRRTVMPSMIRLMLCETAMHVCIYACHLLLQLHALSDPRAQMEAISHRACPR